MKHISILFFCLLFISINFSISHPHDTFDVSGDCKTGLEEVIYALQIVGGIKSPHHPSITNKFNMSFNLIPAGTFLMGSPEDELGRDPTNEDLHQVTLSESFYIQTTEITQGQWQAIMGSNPSHFSSCGSDCPVEMVSWNDVQKFIAKVNQLTCQSYRLPTEAEWEYAARAGSTTAFANGDITETSCGYDANLDAIGWYCGNNDISTKPVAQKQPNAWAAIPGRPKLAV